MPVVGRSPARAEYEDGLERLSPIKKRLIRANPFTCTASGCFNNGRSAPSKLCNACNGTGYTGVVVAADDSHLRKPPAAQIFFMYADIQSGHGLYGSGGEFVRSLVDLGKIALGDATLFTKTQEIDRATGVAFYPDVQGSRVRPDYVLDTTGEVYTVTRHMTIDLGDEIIGRIYTLQTGAQANG